MIFEPPHPRFCTNSLCYYNGDVSVQCGFTCILKEAACGDTSPRNESHGRMIKGGMFLETDFPSNSLFICLSHHTIAIYSVILSNT